MTSGQTDDLEGKTFVGTAAQSHTRRGTRGVRGGSGRGRAVNSSRGAPSPRPPRPDLYSAHRALPHKGTSAIPIVVSGQPTLLSRFVTGVLSIPSHAGTLLLSSLPTRGPVSSLARLIKARRSDGWVPLLGYTGTVIVASGFCLMTVCGVKPAVKGLVIASQSVILMVAVAGHVY